MSYFTKLLGCHLVPLDIRTTLSFQVKTSYRNVFSLPLLGFTGSDCSVDIGKAPVLIGFLPSNSCDIRQRPCQQIRLHVSGVLDSDDLVCQMKRLKVNVSYNAL